MAPPQGPPVAAPRPPEVTTTKQNALHIPYLGPLPQPSRRISRVLEVVLAANILLRLVRMGLLWQRADIDRQLAAGRSVTALSQDLYANASRLGTLQTITTLGLVALVAAMIAWSRTRRPARRKADLGEAYVESPFRSIVPTWLGIATIAGWVAGFGFSSLGQGAGKHTFSQLATLRLESLAATGGLAIGWVLYLLCIELTNRAFDARLAWSLPYRDPRAAVPYFTPVSDGGLLTGSIIAGDVGTPSGVGWILSTAALVMVVLVGVVLVIATLSGGSGPLPLVIGLALIGAVVGFVVRRRRRRRAAPPR